MCLNGFNMLQNNRIKKKQHSIMNIPQIYEPMILYVSNGIYLAHQSTQQPLYFFNPNTSINYQFLPQNSKLGPYLQFQSNFPQCEPLVPFILPNPTQISLNITTQNRKELLQISPKIQNQNACVTKNINFKCQKYVKSKIYKSANDRFIKKNTESNVVNQIFSFLWSPEKSKQYLIKILKDNLKINIFYQIMIAIKVNYKSQLNRHFLKQMTQIEEWEGSFNKLKKKMKKMDGITFQQMAIAIKKLIFLYIRQISCYSIMTSKKMNRQLWTLHFAKCHEISTFLFHQFT